MRKKVSFEVRAIESLIPYARNARTHSPEQVEQIARSIKEFGFLNPVIISANGGILAGHCRVLAAGKLGLKEIPCILETHLTDTQKRAYVLADNQLALNAGWDEELLKIELAELQNEDFNLDLLGFSLEEIENLLKQPDDPATDAKEDDFDEDKTEQRCKKGDVWQLGNHRLMCGDSTSASAVNKLMNGERADIAFTSPPYNMSGGFQTSHKQKLYTNDSVYEEYSDDLNDDEYLEFLQKALDNCLAHCDDVLFNIGYCKGGLNATARLLGNNADKFGGAIIWKKHNAFNPVFDVQLGVLANICEPIYIFNNKGARKLSHPTWTKNEASYNLIETVNAASNEFAKVHKATFPVELPFAAVSRFSQKSCLDLFGGTGTTLIACEQLNRKCYMMELSEKYCDIILSRWEQLTGKKAKKV